MHVSLHVPVCPHCVRSGEQPIVCDRCGWRWHANPMPAAAVLVERGSGERTEILLLRRAVEPSAGQWDLPAGYLDPGESFEHAAVRETREESGLTVELIGLTGVYHSPAANAVAAVFRGRIVGPDDVTLDFESSEHAWITRAQVAGWLARIAFPSMARAIADWGNIADGGDGSDAPPPTARGFGSA
jgi:ADP-ribose pyrophosphatase YjhB (NUDIX family)